MASGRCGADSPGLRSLYSGLLTAPASVCDLWNPGAYSALDGCPQLQAASPLARTLTISSTDSGRESADSAEDWPAPAHVQAGIRPRAASPPLYTNTTLRKTTGERTVLIQYPRGVFFCD